MQVGGEGLMEPLSWVFDMLQYFKTILPLAGKPEDEVYVVGGGTAGELEISLKPQEILITFCTWYVK